MKNEKVKMETVALRAVKFNAYGEKRKKQSVLVRFLFFRRRRSINSARRASVSILTFSFFIFTFYFFI